MAASFAAAARPARSTKAGARRIAPRGAEIVDPGYLSRKTSGGISILDILRAKLHGWTMTIDAGAGTREQADPARRPRVHPDSELTEQQAETLYRMLVDTRRSALERQERLSDDRFTTEQVSESEEAAALDTSQSTSIDLAENERTLLLQIERALGKMGDGTYGVSEESGEPIGFDRLRIVPWATLTTAEQEMAEHEARQRGR